jgi:SAM-dependent methyltransferase
MRSGEAVETYEHYSEITAAERAGLDRVRDEVRGRPILDLGVGAGRTVQPLLELSADYVGVDYTQRMIDTCRRRFPSQRFELADARELSLFGDRTFKLAVFSCNGLCMVGHDDRLQILREVWRVLADDGVFIFSTHNQHSADHTAGFVLPEFRPSRNPLKLGVRALRFLSSTVRGVCNHWRFSRHDLRGAEYSIINDRCHDYATMLYYISLDNQRRQLVEAGFRPGAEAYDLSGRLITGDTTDVSILFIARK